MEHANMEQRVGDLDATLRAHLVWTERHEDKLDAVLEYVRDLPGIKQDIREIKERLAAVESDVEVISVVVKDHSEQFHRVFVRLDRLDSRVGDLEKRVGRIEAKLS